MPLNVTAVFTPPMRNSSDEDLPQEEADNNEDPERNKSELGKIIDDYNAQFGTNFTVELFDEYYRDVQQRVKDQKYPNKDLPHAKKLDIVIVVEMMLTGFDSKFLNTLYVAPTAFLTAPNLTATSSATATWKNRWTTLWYSLADSTTTKEKSTGWWNQSNRWWRNTRKPSRDSKP